MKCVVLGGGGFIGSHLCQALLAAGHGVRIFDRPNLKRFDSAAESGPAEWLEGDFSNPEDLARAAEGCEVVYHLISTTLPKSSNDNPVYDVETNVIGTLRLLELVRGTGTKIVFVSSGGTVYGVPRAVPIPETHPTEPLCSYGIGKLAVEKYLRLYQVLHGIDYCALRLANLYGERQRVTTAQGAVAVFLHRALRDEPIEIWGDGGVVRDYLYAGDAAAALVRAAAATGEPRLFNVGSGRGQSLNDILAAIETLLGRPVRRTYLPGRRFDVPVNVLDVSLAARHLGWRPATAFAEGLSRTCDWMRRNPD
ncbi:MAG: NAD-dependent epimerase/dehydratase family protein [Betaproteobacteria bacterium]|nr:NAD-dependent epimerase/dehydratase family protein [Betaproteobacteria bacterium]